MGKLSAGMKRAITARSSELFAEDTTDIQALGNAVELCAEIMELISIPITTQKMNGKINNLQKFTVFHRQAITEMLNDISEIILTKNRIKSAYHSMSKVKEKATNEL